jgi:hypothetical protein
MMVHIPDLSGVPDVSEVESACRVAGAMLRHHPDRARAHARLLRLVERKDADGVDADVDALTKYFRGGFDRKQSHGRPIDEVQLARLENAVEQVQEIRSAEHCTRNEAIRRLLARRGYADRPDLFKKIRNYMNR